MNKQLALFSEEVGFSRKKNKIRQHNSQKIDAIANHILRKIKNESKSMQESIVCTMYYYTICDNLDKMPKNMRIDLVVRLIERYFNIKDNKDYQC